MSNTTVMKAPAGFTGSISVNRSTPPSSGQSYTADADGYVTVDPRDVSVLLAAGFTFPVQGLGVLSLIQAKNADGTTLAAAASSGKFGLALTAGTSENLAGEAAQNNTKTDTALFELVVPANYILGTAITVTVNAKIAGTGTAGTKTLAVHAYRVGNDGTHGADLVSTAAQNLTTSNADYAFTIAAATINPGDRLVLTLVTALQETGNVATINSQINSLRLA